VSIALAEARAVHDEAPQVDSRRVDRRFNLYCKLPFGRLHRKNPRIIELAQMLDRTPDSVAMKLVNLAALDPTHRQCDVSGLGNTSKSDRTVCST
jgi:hypothetical protein